MQNAEFRMQNSECKMQNAELKIVFRFNPATQAFPPSCKA